MNLTRRECLEAELRACMAKNLPPADSLCDDLIAAWFQSLVLLKRATYLINAMGAPKPWFKIWR